jgi:hypothetical protein
MKKFAQFKSGLFEAHYDVANANKHLADAEKHRGTGEEGMKKFKHHMHMHHTHMGDHYHEQSQIGNSDTYRAKAAKLRDEHREKAKKYVTESTIVYPVINARSPADQEFTDAHPAQVIPDPAKNGDEVYKGITSKDISRRADKWTGDDDADDASAENGLDTAGTYHNKKIAEALAALEESFDGLTDEQIEESVKGPYHAAYADAKAVLKPEHHKAAAKMFARMNRGSDEHEELKRANLHHSQELKPVLKKHKIAEETLQLQEISKKVLGSYIKKASDDQFRNGAKISDSRHAGKHDESGKIAVRTAKRMKGIAKASDKLTKD